MLCGLRQIISLLPPKGTFCQVVRFQRRWLSCLYKLVKMLSVCMCVCLDANQGGTNHDMVIISVVTCPALVVHFGTFFTFVEDSILQFLVCVCAFSIVIVLLKY